LCHPELRRELRPAAVNHFLTFLYVPAPLTMFDSIEELPAGHLIIAERGEVTSAGTGSSATKSMPT